MTIAIDYIEQFRRAMVLRGLAPPDQVLADGKLHRCDTKCPGGSNDGAYLLHVDGVPAGGMQNHRDGRGWENWRADLGGNITPAEEAQHLAVVEAQRAQRMVNEQRLQAAAAAEARRILAKAKAGAEDHPYVQRKGIRPFGAKLQGKNLVVPAMDCSGTVWSVQTIAPDGTKRFLAHGKKRGCYFGIGKADKVVVIAEGFATACSIHEATRLPVAVAFDCGNLLPVARALRALHPAICIILAADDDSGTEGNPGLARANEAAGAVGGSVAVPSYCGQSIPGGGDFNDLHQRHGLAAVKDVFAAELSEGLTNTMPSQQKKVQGADDTRDGIVLLKGSDMTPEPIRWLWSGWLARGKLHLLAGAPGIGKSTLACRLAATLSVGGTFPDGSRCDASHVLVWSGEDDPKDTGLPRVLAAGADPDRVHFVAGTRVDGNMQPFDPARDLVQLAAAAQEIGNVGLLIVDPVVSAVSSDSHKNSEVRRALQPLVDLASTLNCAVLGISHFGKGTGGRDPVERVIGSIAFSAVARVLMVAAQVKDDDGREYRLLARAKSNIGADSGGFEYATDVREVAGYPGVTASIVSWGAPIEGRAKELLAQPDDAGNERPNAMVRAKAFLCELLAGGPVPQKTVKVDAEAAGHSWSTIRRASDNLGVWTAKVRKNEPGWPGWTWNLPASDQANLLSEQHEHVEQVEQHGQLAQLAQEAQLDHGVQVRQSEQHEPEWEEF